MDTSLPSHVLEDQHRRIDAGVQAVIDGHGSHVGLAESLALLDLHLYAEEAILIPPLQQAGLGMPVFVMQREHGLMWPLLRELDAACATGQPLDALRDACRELFALLRVHNPKEERILYAAADRLATAKADGSLVAALAGAARPHAWKCAAAH